MKKTIKVEHDNGPMDVVDAVESVLKNLGVKYEVNYDLADTVEIYYDVVEEKLKNDLHQDIINYGLDDKDNYLRDALFDTVDKYLKN